MKRVLRTYVLAWWFLILSGRFNYQPPIVAGPFDNPTICEQIRKEAVDFDRSTSSCWSGS